MKKNGHESRITHHSSRITHHSITHFLSPNNDEISHSACLATNTQLCFQHKKLKKLGPTHSELTCAPDPLPDPINSIHQLNTSLYQITFLLHFISHTQHHQWLSLKHHPPAPTQPMMPLLSSSLLLIETEPITAP